MNLEPTNPDSNQDAETRHINKVVRAFQSYRQFSTDIVTEKLQAVRAKPVIDRLNAHYPLICHNQYFLDQITSDTSFLGYTHAEIPDGEGITLLDYDKVRSTIKQFAREWSMEGEYERKHTFGLILSALESIYNEEASRSKVKVLVPGSGLARLPFEICRRGFTCQGNEFSMYMLLASNYILNRVSEPNSIEIYPWIHQFSNIPSAKVQLAAVSIPDTEASGLEADFSMVGGDFVQVYGHQKDEWDCVIDTARNMSSYLKVIGDIIKPGGKWIHLGPLLYHFEGNPHSDSVEYTKEEFLDMVESFGFEIQESKETSSVYASCPHSMSEYVYHSLFFIAQK